MVPLPTYLTNIEYDVTTPYGTSGKLVATLVDAPYPAEPGIHIIGMEAAGGYPWKKITIDPKWTYVCHIIHR